MRDPALDVCLGRLACVVVLCTSARLVRVATRVRPVGQLVHLRRAMVRLGQGQRRDEGRSWRRRGGGATAAKKKKEKEEEGSPPPPNADAADANDDAGRRRRRRRGGRGEYDGRRTRAAAKKKKKKRSKKKKPTGTGSKEPLSRLLGGFTMDSYVRYGRAEPPTIPSQSCSRPTRSPWARFKIMREVTRSA